MQIKTDRWATFFLGCWMVAALRPASAAGGVQFVDVAEEAGITAFVVSGKMHKYIVEGMMGGVAFFDYDGDGDVDAYITNGSRFEGFSGEEHPFNHLYRNEGDGRFTDVTAAAGVGDTTWSMGCTVADYDNDGDADLYVTNFGRNTLYRNEGDGRFTDVTAAAGVGVEGWSTGGTFGDYDLDGDVDLYVANYIDFDPDYKSTVPCLWRNIRVYCGPLGLVPADNFLFRNEGDGTFIDVTEEAGLRDKAYYSFTSIFSDYNDDGWPDLYVVDDESPNRLYENLGDGTFEDVALMAGVAYGGDGEKQGGMGGFVGDYNNDGLFDIFVANFADEHNTLYMNEGEGFFTDITFTALLGTKGVTEVAWGTALFDYDNDGDKDLFVSNGHLYPEANQSGLNTSYPEQNLLYENMGDGRFAYVSDQAGPGLAILDVSRGASFADFDEDGDIDILVNNINGRPDLLRNDGGNRNNYLKIRTIGTRSNRDGIGTRIAVTAGGKTQYGEVQSSGSYISHNDFRVHFGLGQASVVERIELRWPSGTVQELTGVAANQVLEVREPESD